MTCDCVMDILDIIVVQILCNIIQYYQRLKNIVLMMRLFFKIPYQYQWSSILILIPEDSCRFLTNIRCFTDTNTQIILIPILILGYGIIPIPILEDSDTTSFLVLVKHQKTIDIIRTPQLKMTITSTSIVFDLTTLNRLKFSYILGTLLLRSICIDDVFVFRNPPLSINLSPP